MRMDARKPREARTMQVVVGGRFQLPPKDYFRKLTYEKPAWFRESISESLKTYFLPAIVKQLNSKPVILGLFR